MIKIKHTKHYERMMCSNKVEYSTVEGPYCTTHDIKVPFCMPEFYIRNIIQHQFCVENDIGESGTGYDMIIGRDRMVKIVQLDNFKRNLLLWNGVTIPMK